FVLLLLGMIVRDIRLMRRTSRTGARVRASIAGLFSVIAAPAILMALAGSVIIDHGVGMLLQARSTMNDTKTVANIYGLEHLQIFRRDTVALAIAVTRAKQLFDQDRDLFRQGFVNQASPVRSTAAAMLLDGEGKVIVKAEFNGPFDVALPTAAALASVTDGEPRLEPVPNSNFITSLIKMRGYDNTYLFMAHALDPRVMKIGANASIISDAFHELENRRVDLQVAFALMFSLVALTMLLSAVWVALSLAKKLASSPTVR